MCCSDLVLVHVVQSGNKNTKLLYISDRAGFLNSWAHRLKVCLKNTQIEEHAKNYGKLLLAVERLTAPAGHKKPNAGESLV